MYFQLVLPQCLTQSNEVASWCMYHEGWVTLGMLHINFAVMLLWKIRSPRQLDESFDYTAGSSAMQLSPAPPGTVFIDASEVRKLIESNGYFQRFSRSCASVLEDVMDNDLALCALGGLIRHLSRLKVGFFLYIHKKEVSFLHVWLILFCFKIQLDDALHNGDISPYEVFKRCLRMDGQTLLNLEIFSNNVDGSPAGKQQQLLYAHPHNSKLFYSHSCGPI